MGCDETRDLRLGYLDWYSKVKFRNLGHRVYRSTNGNSVVENVKSVNARCTKSKVGYENNSIDIFPKRVGRNRRISVISTNELPVSRAGNVFGYKNPRTASLLAVLEEEIVSSSIEQRGVLIIEGCKFPSREKRIDWGTKEECGFPSREKMSGMGNNEEHTRILVSDRLDQMSNERTAIEMLDALKDERSKRLGDRFQVGDMVWGKVQSYPWWPGQIFNEALASPSARRTKTKGCVLVAFYGDNTYAWLDLANVLPFDPHDIVKLKQKNDPDFSKALEAAMDEVKRRAALGVACRCRGAYMSQPTKVEGFFEVDVTGFAPGVVYSMEQIVKARDDFQQFKARSFVQELALIISTPSCVERNDDMMRDVAKIIAYRKATFEETDETYKEALQWQTSGCENSKVVSTAQEKAIFQEAPADDPFKIAEAPEGSNGLALPPKVNHPQKRNKCLFERKDDLNVSKVGHSKKGYGDHLSKKRARTVTAKHDSGGKQNVKGILCNGNATLSPGITSKDATSTGKKPAVAKITQSSAYTGGSCNVNLSEKRKSPDFNLKDKALLRGKSMIAEGRGDMKSSIKPMEVKDSPKKVKSIFGIRDKPKDSRFYALSENSGVHAKKRALPSVMTLESEAKQNARTTSSPGSTEKESSSVDKNRMASKVPMAAAKENSLKKPETTTRPAKPILLEVTFPNLMKLPTVAEIKLKFSCFGPLLNTSFVRSAEIGNIPVYKVVFVRESDAHAAIHALENGILFKDNVAYRLLDLQYSARKFPGGGHSRNQLVKEALDRILPSSSSSIVDYAGETSSKELEQMPSHSNVQLKSCLKKKDDGMVGSTTTAIAAPTTTADYDDFSRQMLNLLKSCSDIVAGVERSFGKVPYREL